MALDAGDRARLREIESGLIRDDPGLAKKFWTWRPSAGGPQPFLPGWSVVPPWALLVFVVAICTWMVSPMLGVLVVLAGIGRMLTLKARPAAPRTGGSGGGRGSR